MPQLHTLTLMSNKSGPNATAMMVATHHAPMQALPPILMPPARLMITAIPVAAVATMTMSATTKRWQTGMPGAWESDRLAPHQIKASPPSAGAAAATAAVQAVAVILHASVGTCFPLSGVHSAVALATHASTPS